MKLKISVAIIIFSIFLVGFQSSPYARRIRPFISTPVSCQENEIGYNMVSHTLLICTNSGYTTVATGSGITNSAGNNVIPKSDGTNLIASHITETSDRNNIPALAGGEFDAAFASESGWTLSATQLTDNSYTPNQFLAVLENADSGAFNGVSGAVAGVYDKRTSGDYGAYGSLNLDTIKIGNSNVDAIYAMSAYVWNQAGGTIGRMEGFTISLESDNGTITNNASAIRIKSPFFPGVVSGKAIGLDIASQVTSAVSGSYAIYYDAPDSKTFAVEADGDVIANANISAANYLTGSNRIYSSGTPSISGDGTLNTNSKDSAGKTTSTTTGAASIVLTFSTAFQNAPACNANNETTANLARTTSTTTQVTIIGTTITGDVVSYSCIGY